MSGAMDLGAGIGGGLGALAGYLFGGEDRDKQERLLEDMLREWDTLSPSVKAQVEQAFALGPSAMEGVTTDPALRTQQMQAAQGLMEMGTAGGMDAGSRARLAQAQSQSAQQERGARLALQQQAQARGQGNSLTSYATQLAAQQGAAQRLGQESVQAAGDASQRALAALAQGGTLSGQIRGQDFGEAAARASARDAIAEFNLRNRQAVQGRNVDRNYASQQDTFNNKARVAEGRNGVRGQQAGLWGRREEDKRRIGYGIGSAVGAGVGALAGGG